MMRKSNGGFELIQSYRDATFKLNGLLGAVQTFVNEQMSDSAKISCIKALLEDNYDPKTWQVE